MTVPQQVQYQNQPSAQPQQAPQQQAQAPQAQAQVPQHQVQQQIPQQGQVQQVQQHSMPPLNGGWQSESDIEARRTMIAKIVQLLQARKPNAPQDWLNKLPQMAKRLEETLYRSAPSFAAYNDGDTLKQRLQQLAMRMKTPRNQQQRAQQQMRYQQQQQAQQQVQQQQVQQPLPQQQAAQTPVQPQPQQQVVQQPQSQGLPGEVQQNQRMVNMSDINPIMASNPQQTQPVASAPAPTISQVTPAYQQQSAPIMNGGSRPVNGSVAPPPQPLASASTSVPVQQPITSQSHAPPPAPAPAGAGNQRTNSDRAQVLRHQQQRLLLLRHAAKCPHEDGQCPVTPHCAGMKRLWKHIAECKNQKCQVPHCVSSRYVLSHYHRCKDVRCPVCGPVREAIHRSHEKQKQMSQLKQNHEQSMQQRKVPSAPTSSQVPQPTQQISSAQQQPPLKKQRTAQIPPNHLVPVAQPSAPTAVRSGVPHQSRPGYIYNRPANVQGQRAKPQEDLTLINSFTIDQIKMHIESLNRGLQLAMPKLKACCGEVLKVLQTHEHGWVFNAPVDPVELGLPDYFEVVKRPMDLGTIKKRLENGCYNSLEGFQVDVNLTFDNAMLYNPEGSVVYNMAKKMKEIFTKDFKDLINKLKAEEDAKRRKGDACALCGSEKLLFEPPVFYCNGLKCTSARIRRNSYYYVGGNNKYHWCHQCYGDMKENQEIQMPDATFRKGDLVKKKNDEVREESWVHCDRCQRWIHQICGLFNTRKNQDQTSEYVCPRCTMEERKQKGQIEGTTHTPMAKDLQRTKLSEYLENHVHDKVEEYINKVAKEKADRENIPMEQARKDFEMGGPITIRQVTSMDRKLEVRDHMKKRYAFKKYPAEFNFRCKCIIVFQNLDGVDVILFGLYVYEHDEKVPAPNKRTVYLSYLDSIHYMRPRKMRTYIYHEILISYLDYVRKRGFSTCHIWACPPGKGDDYILYAKPEDQKTPRDDRLKNWYYTMLKKAQERGIIGKVTNMYDLYFKDTKNDATVIPYMEGDYFPGEVEKCIGEMEEGKHSKKATSDGKKKKKAKAKQKKAGRKPGTRSTGVDEEALAASGILPPGYDQKSMEQGNQDYVMKKVGQVIEPLKDSFIVAYLSWEGAKKEDMVVPKEIMEARAKLASEAKAREDAKKAGENKADTEKAPDTNSSADTAKDAKTEDTDVKMDDAGGINEKNDEKDNKGNPTNGTSTTPIETMDTTDDSKMNTTDNSKMDTNDDSKKDTNDDSKKDTNDDSKKDTITHPKATTNSSPEKPKDETQVATSDDSAKEKSTVVENTAMKPAEKADVKMEEKENPEEKKEEKKEENKGGTEEKKEEKPDSKQSEEVKKKITAIQRDGKFAAMEARKRTIEGKIKTEDKKDAPADKDKDKKQKSVMVTVKDRHGKLVKVLDDDEEEMDCEFLNNRQLFLELCQTNNYQFDQMRRAKHSSMMVLWHLHNRDAPKFVQQCQVCAREIISGYRYHCPTCADFDLCQECYQKPSVPRHPHQLKPIPVVKQKEQTEEQRRERQRSIQLHMTLLMHAATCTSPKCHSQNCAKMKGLLQHGQNCKQKVAGGCNVCKRIWTLLQIHARQCKESKCPVPKCHPIRERFRQIQAQQRAMDDRRRQHFNSITTT